MTTQKTVDKPQEANEGGQMGRLYFEVELWAKI